MEHTAASCWEPRQRFNLSKPLNAGWKQISLVPTSESLPPDVCCLVTFICVVLHPQFTFVFMSPVLAQQRKCSYRANAGAAGMNVYRQSRLIKPYNLFNQSRFKLAGRRRVCVCVCSMDHFLNKETGLALMNRALPDDGIYNLQIHQRVGVKPPKADWP